MATNCDPIHDLRSSFQTKIATQLHKIVLETDIYIKQAISTVPM